jgi:hypothetical protein
LSRDFGRDKNEMRASGIAAPWRRRAALRFATGLVFSAVEIT